MLFMLVVALLDPLVFGASLVPTVLFARRSLHVLVIGVAVGVIGETLLTAERTRQRYAARLAMMS